MFARSLQACRRAVARSSRLALASAPPSCSARHYVSAVTVNGFEQLKPTTYGQPLAPSHAHLIRTEEITPGIPQEEYDRRRRELVESLPDDSLVVCVAGQVKYMSGRESLSNICVCCSSSYVYTSSAGRNIVRRLITMSARCCILILDASSYKFRQSSDFWYLTGFDEPDAAVILEKRPSSPRGYYMRIYSAGTDSAKEKWDGARTSPEDVVQYFGADEAEPTSALPAALRRLVASASYVYLDVPNHSKRARTVSPKSLLKVCVTFIQPDAGG